MIIPVSPPSKRMKAEYNYVQTFLRDILFQLKGIKIKQPVTFITLETDHLIKVKPMNPSLLPEAMNLVIEQPKTSDCFCDNNGYLVVRIPRLTARPAS